MTIKVNTQDLAKALATVCPLAGKNKALSVTNNIKVVIKDGKARLQAFDGESTIRKYITLLNGGETGEFLINADGINNYVKAIKGDEISIDIAGQTAVVSHKNGKAQFSVLDTTDFPDISTDEADENEFTMPADFFYRAICDSAFFVGSDDLRPMLQYAQIVINENETTYAATDTRRLVYNKTAGQADVNAEILVSKRLFPMLSKLCSEVSTIRIKTMERHILYDFGHTKIYQAKLKQTFPNVNRVIPQSHANAATINVADFRDAVKRILSTSPDVSLAKFSFDNTGLTINALNITRGITADDYVPCECDGEIKIGLNIAMLLDLLSVIESENVTMLFLDKSRPVVLKSDYQPERIMLLMPMTITD